MDSYEAGKTFKEKIKKRMIFRLCSNIEKSGVWVEVLEKDNKGLWNPNPWLNDDIRLVLFGNEKLLVAVSSSYLLYYIKKKHGDLHFNSGKTSVGLNISPEGLFQMSGVANLISPLRRHILDVIKYGRDFLAIQESLNQVEQGETTPFTDKDIEKARENIQKKYE